VLRTTFDLGVELSAATAARPTIVPSLFTASQSVRACRLVHCSLCHPICTTSARVNTVILLTPIPIYQPTKYHSTLYTPRKHQHATALSPAQSAVRNPARSALKRDIRALTSPPAWLAAVARCCCALLDSICFNGHLITPAYIHLPTTNICCIIARSLPYMHARVLLALT